MKRSFHIAGSIVLALGAATGPVLAGEIGQLSASAGISAEQAASMTLTEIARVKFNAGSRNDDRIGAGRAVASQVDEAHGQLIAAAGLTPEEAAGMNLTEIVAIKQNNDARGDERIVIRSGRDRVATGGSGARQLAASAGLDAGEARTMTLQQIYRAKLSGYGDND